MRRILCLWFLAAVAGCGKGDDRQSPSTAPAVEKPHVESDLARVTLAPERAQGIRTRPARIALVQDRLLLPGWVMVKPGNEVTLTAPVAGYVLAGADADLAPGHDVSERSILFRLRPVLSPLEQIQLATLKRGVESELSKARESVALAGKEFKRVEELHQQKLRGQQDLEQAGTRLRHAREDLKSAQDKLDLFGKAAEKNALPLLDVAAPRSGKVLSVPVSPGQYVPAAAPLLTLADLSHLWLRVPVPEGDLPRLLEPLKNKAPAAVVLRPRDGKGKKPPLLPLVNLVPTVDPVRRTVDVIYELSPEAREHGLQAREQMVQVAVPVSGKRKESLVSYDAVVYDAHAGAWIYIDRTAPGDKKKVYERRRVELGPTDGDEVAVRARLSGATDQLGPACTADDRVVVVGAAVLFSSEFYKP
jgi:multidrug efflux pump subunit AcrA (membrane-fusion protein)